MNYFILSLFSTKSDDQRIRGYESFFKDCFYRIYEEKKTRLKVKTVCDNVAGYIAAAVAQILEKHSLLRNAH